MKRPMILDANGRPLALGDRIKFGGTVVEFIEPDESHWAVAVQWDDDKPGDPEIFPTGGPTVYMDEGSAHRCDDVERFEVYGEGGPGA